MRSNENVPPCVLAEIRRASALLHDPGAVVEMRALGVDGRTQRVDAGYFDNPDAFADAARGLSGRSNVYMTLNAINPALLSRAANRIMEWAKQTTSDHEVLCRCWLLVDLDPVRPASIASADGEHAAAIERAQAITRWLVEEMGCSAPIIMDSGNGVVLLVRVALPADPDTLVLVKRCLAALSLRFSDDVVTVDTSVANAARIVRVAGTLNAKGDDTPERPHRIARLLQVPEPIVITPRDRLEALAALVPAEPAPAARSNGAFDLDGFMAEHLPDARSPLPWGAGRKWILDPSPMCDHHDGAPFLVQFASGAIAAGCLHNSCAWTWRDLRAHLDPSWRERSADERPNAKRPAVPLPGPAGSSSHVAPVIWTAADLATADLPMPRSVVNGMIVEGVTVLASRPKLGKSWLLLGLGIATATGGRALSALPVERGEVLYLALEDNARRLQSRLATILQGGPAPSGLHIATDWPRADGGGLDLLDQWLAAHRDARLVCIDTLARFRPRRRNGDASYELDYASIEPLAALAAQHRVANVVSHHDRKADAVDFLDTVSGTLGITGAADSVLVLRRERGQADASLHITGRDVEEREIALKWDAHIASWTLLGDADEYRRSRERAKIVALLQKSGPLGPKDAAAALDKNYATVRWLLADMAGKGEIANAVRGVDTANDVLTSEAATNNPPTNGGYDPDDDLPANSTNITNNAPAIGDSHQHSDGSPDSDVGMFAMFGDPKRDRVHHSNAEVAATIAVEADDETEGEL